MSITSHQKRERCADNSEFGQSFQQNIKKDILALRRSLISMDLYKELQDIKKPILLRSLLDVMTDWVIIFVAFVIYEHLGIGSLPVAIVIVGNRQRALGNLLHEASHYNFGDNKSLADWMSTLLVALPLFSPLYRYRELHNSHHRYLGRPSGDVDLIEGIFKSDARWYQMFFWQACSFKVWWGSTLGLIPQINTIGRMKIFTWWISFLLILGYITSMEFSITFLLVWVFARATTFHLITVFREISDHGGLMPGNIIDFTRNNPTQGVLRMIFHPHNNGYHLAHHLDPSIPYFAFPKAHKLLMSWSRYAEAEHCDAYFSGSNPVILSWEKSTKQIRPNSI